MQEIIALFAGQYRLTNAEVIAEIEAFFSASLSQWYRLPVMVFFRDDLRLEAVTYNQTGGVIMQRLVEMSEIKGRGTLKRQLETNLAKAVVLKQTARYKHFEKEMLWGEITACDAEQNLYVETEVIAGERVTAICPVNRIGLHERHSGDFAIGRKRAFHLRRVEPVMLNGTPRFKVVVDRVSKTLVETLLRSQLGPDAERIKLRCLKRYVGHKSIVFSTGRLPKSAIIAVDRELKERVQVKIVKSLPGD
ncbi:hypothetical protein C4565_10145 [Candidatus Parcubacteria bacterium]|nr:MAG: hypothetical protein C4565_10145 [Candidatus Parcubacteria bacterium]